ncbi:hypothetical protein LTR65_008297 [Meristemomyces frigidus]
MLQGASKSSADPAGEVVVAASVAIAQPTLIHPPPPAAALFGSLAEPLSDEVLNEWRWRIYSDGTLSAAEQRFEECLQIPEGREPNDYDDLLDNRVYSPNIARNGHPYNWIFGLNRQDIERDNTFTPLSVFEEDYVHEVVPPELAPFPEDARSVEAMYAGSLQAEDNTRVESPGLMRTEPPERRADVGMGLRELPRYAHRLRRLAPEIRTLVLSLV